MSRTSSERAPTAYGSWTSPITAELIVQVAVGLGGPAFGDGDLWWSELRPTEAGRVQIVRKALDAGPDTARDVLPDGFSARTRVHEYGGGAWWLHDDTLFFVNWTDQRVHRVDRAGTDRAGDPVAITPEPDQPHGFRYADGRVTDDGDWIVCVREWHGAPGATEARNELVAIPTSGVQEPTVLLGGTQGPDFVSNPRVSPDGRLLCWLQWNHPDMPWDATELWVARLDEGSYNATPCVTDAERVAGGPGESIVQPEWSPDNELWFASDRSGFWALHSIDPLDEAHGPRVRTDDLSVDVGQPQWVFGQSSYCFAPLAAEADPAAADVALVARQPGADWLGLLAAGAPTVGRRQTPFTSIEGICSLGPELAVIGTSFTEEPQVATLRLDATGDGTSVIVHRPGRDLGIDAGEWLSTPEHIEFPTTPNGDGSDAVAFALFYPPRNPDHQGPSGELPPLMVMSHGGPTSAARPLLNLIVQFWTSRGFAVVDVNYRGSTGYGRAFRDALKPTWGIADVDDCIAAARFLAAERRVDGARLAIRGGSAGGFTTLCALAFHDDFTAGTSLYGVADLEALAKDTHKFESRYLDRLVGPYPEQRQVYVDRSPIHHVDRLDTPLLILQGLEDEIVPPAQSEVMADALRRKGVPHAYIAFEGEQHGFRQAPNIRRALEAELYFYSRIFGFESADRLEPVEIR